MKTDNQPISNKVIALAADERYCDKVMTTIKSICFHNRDITFYLFNRDISAEWFDSLNHYLRQINCQIIDVKINLEVLKNYKTLEHISSEATYYRYFISEAIPDNKVLYLDSDLVVNGSLDVLFELDLQDNFVAATLDDIAKNYHKTINFNAGVLLINNRLWKKENITEKAIAISNEKVNELPDGDQSVLNILFENRWAELNPLLNYLVGAEYLYLKNNLPNLIIRKENQMPVILHFNTQYKPWLPYYDLPFRQYYWFYYRLSWQQILEKYQ